MGKSYWMKDEDQKGNFSNDKTDTFEEKKRYIGVRLQQGVPLLDRDWNELEDIRRYEERITRKYYIGDGTPDDGFKISACNSPDDFNIGNGRCLVEGFEVVNDPQLSDFSVSNYKGQANIQPLNTQGSEGREDYVYIDVWIEEVDEHGDNSLLNSKDLNEVTTLRHKINWRVKVSEGSKPPEPLEFHHHYKLAKIKRTPGKGNIDHIEDLRAVRGNKISWKPADTGKNGWNNVSGYNPAGYFRDMNGIVHLRGGIFNESLENGKLIFELEDGYKPANKELRIVACLSVVEDKDVGNYSVCEISAEGKVTYIFGSNFDKLLSLDGITFIVAPSKSDPQ